MTKGVKKRTLWLVVIFGVCFFGLLARVAWLQIVQSDELLAKAKTMWDANSQIPATRGVIYDRNGTIMAQDDGAYTVALNPQEIAEKNALGVVVKKLAPIIGVKEDKLSKFATKKRSDGTLFRQVEVRNEGWKINDEKEKQVRKLITELRAHTKDRYFNGVVLIDDTVRSYPGGKKASHVLGYFDKTGKAFYGVEQQYDKYLRGVPGKVNYERFAENRHENGGRVNLVPEQDGKSVHLTIDNMIQGYIEEALDEYNEKFKPKSMIAVAVDPNTMEVLGMANRPNFNPNEYWNFASQADFFNYAVGARYEPGSTFKIVTLAGAVEKNMFHPDEKFMSGAVKAGGHTIHDHNYKGWGEISYLEGLVRSSNVGFVKLGYERLGPQRLEDYIRKFGFGQKTNIDLPNEINGFLDLEHQSDFAAATYGQGRVAVTAMQQVVAVASVANGGKLMQPYLLKKVVDPETQKVIFENKPKMIRRTVTEQAAQQVSQYLEQVISNQEIGTGRKAYFEGYRMAGKTGTANKVINGSYSTNKWVLSFIGYAPVVNPKIMLCIIVDEPDLGGNYRRGSEVAPPMFKKIMVNSLKYMNIPYETKNLDREKFITVSTKVPDLQALSVQQATDTVQHFQLQPVIFGEGKQVLAQYPAAGKDILQYDKVYAITDVPGKIGLPDLTGYSLREVLQICSLLDKQCQTDGEGFAVKQQMVKRGAEVVTMFSFASREQQAKQQAEQQVVAKQDAGSEQDDAKPSE